MHDHVMAVVCGDTTLSDGSQPVSWLLSSFLADQLQGSEAIPVSDDELAIGLAVNSCSVRLTPMHESVCRIVCIFCSFLSM